jgi:hypothetical protein
MIWDDRQDLLAAQLAFYGATDATFRVDLEGLGPSSRSEGDGRAGLGELGTTAPVPAVSWEDAATGKLVAVADATFLGSWIPTTGSLLAGWANRSLPPAAVAPPVEGVPTRGTTDDSQIAWAWAFAIAESVDAESVYCAVAEEGGVARWSFLGLRRLRRAGASVLAVSSPPTAVPGGRAGSASTASTDPAAS